MLFRRRNVRTNKLYGFSHVEQIVVTAKTWLARQASNLEYYDAGSVPDGFLSAHKDWTTQEIKLYDDLMNVRLSGQIAERKKVVITPWDSKFTQTKQVALMDPFDEWLARIAVFRLQRAAYALREADEQGHRRHR
ncbi:protein, putative phage associated protein, partial [mine drainage metagenome]